MNLENIREGIRVPNYRKLCELLEEKAEAGNSKNAQLRKWNQFFSYQREGNAYIITEIYAAPKTVDDRRMKYAQNLIPILLHHLAAVGTTELTFDRWFVTLGMISDGFYDEDKIDEVCFFMGLKTKDIQNAVVKLTKLCKDRLMNVLRRLEKERIVSVVENEYIVKGSARKLATAEECAQIRSCKNDVLKHMGATDMFYININPNRRLQFYENLNAEYRERFGWDRTYTLLKVLPSNMDEIRNYGDVDVQPMIKALSDDIKAAITVQLHTECDKADKKCLEEWENGEGAYSFKLDRMKAEQLIHMLWNEI